MINIFNILRDKLNKPLLFGIYGGLGCLLAAILLGEIFLDLTKLPPSVKTNNQAIAVLMDTSSSMRDGKLDEAKSAALGFVQRRDLSKDQLSVVHFGDTINIDAPLTGDRRQLETAISNLSEAGGTPMAEGIEASISVLKNVSKQDFIPSILLFTDGQPNSPAQALLMAQSARGQKINIIAVATGDADVNYLTS
ncbi:MAG: vWA domain-containing protein, partial [Snowella sp.]